jgi:quercetin dioxygenase-like cupin family protein
MTADPVQTDPGLYKVIFENERVRVLEYRDLPGDRTHAHAHPDSVMYTLSAFRRRVSAGDSSVDVSIGPGEVRWVGAQEHWGENIGDSETISVFVELKEPRPADTRTAAAQLGPTGP